VHEHCARAFSVNGSYILTISSLKLSKKEFRPPIQQTHWPEKIFRLTHNPILLNISFTDDTMPYKGCSMACTLSSLEETMWIESIVFCAAKKITSSTFCVLHSLLAICVVPEYFLCNTNPDAQDDDVKRRIVAAK